MEYTEVTTLTVTAEQAGKRLDSFLVEAHGAHGAKVLSRARARALLDQGGVLVDGRHARKGDTLLEGAKVEVFGEVPPDDFSPVPEPEGELVLRFEDPSFVVVDKPAGMPAHPLRPGETGTLANRTVARFPETAGVGFRWREPGLLHRLDTDTSGLVLIARSAEVFDRLRATAKSGGLQKRYLALVEGRLSGEGEVNFPLVPHRKDPKRVEAVTEHIRLRAGTKTHEARTRYRVARAVGDFTLLEVEVETAFRHQVRVHLAALGHPLVGDSLYRGPALHGEYGLTRHFLHASELVFAHPKTGAEVRVVSALPSELSGVLGKLRA